MIIADMAIAGETLITEYLFINSRNSSKYGELWI